jgi:hypothetical protein
LTFKEREGKNINKRVVSNNEKDDDLDEVKGV